MVPMDRRQFVAASGLVAVAGCLARGNENDASSNESDGIDGARAGGAEGLPEPLTTVLDPVPSAVDDSELRYLYVVTPDPDGPGNQGVTLFDVEQLGLDADAVDRMATGIYGQYAGRINVVSGEFDADEVDAREPVATSAEDGFAVTARSGTGSWETGIEAAESAADDPDVGIDGTLPIETLLGPVTDADMAVVVPDLDAESISEQLSIDDDAVEAIAMGRSADVEAREQTVTYVAAFADGESPDEAVIEEILQADTNDVDADDVDVETGEHRATTTYTHELPQSRLPDNSPDVYVSIASSPRDDTVALRFSGEESVDAANLKYRVDGEQAEPPWDEDDTLEDGDSFEIDVPPMTHVAVLWIDPELEDVEQPLGHSVVNSNDAFTGTYDHDADELTVEYTLDRTVDADRFDVVRRAQESAEETTTPLTEHVDVLEAGTEIVLTDVDFGQWITIEMNVEAGSDLTTETVFYFSADPPGQFTHEHEDGGHVLVYQDDAEAAAESFRVSIDGEPAETQWSDAAETLTAGDRLELDAEVGDAVTVEYVGDDEPVEVYAGTVLPDAEFAFDVGESTVEITHDGGDAIDAEKLSVDVFPSANDTHGDAFTAEYDTVEEDDSVTVEYEPREDSEATPYVTVQFDGQTLDHFVQSMRGNGGSGSGGNSGSDDGSTGDDGSAEDDGSGGTESESTSTQAAEN